MKGSKLDEHRAEIVAMLERGVPKKRIAHNFSVNPGSLYYWLNSRDIPFRIKGNDPEPGTLQPYAEGIYNYISGTLSNEVYRLCSQNMERLEHRGLWLGNGHHAAQRMQAKIMVVLKPLLKEVIDGEVLRRENPNENTS